MAAVDTRWKRRRRAVGLSAHDALARFLEGAARGKAVAYLAHAAVWIPVDNRNPAELELMHLLERACLGRPVVFGRAPGDALPPHEEEGGAAAPAACEYYGSVRLSLEEAFYLVRAAGRHAVLVQLDRSPPWLSLLPLLSRPAPPQAHGVDALLIYPRAPDPQPEGSGPLAPLTHAECWQAFRALRPSFHVTCAAYLYLRSAGWVPRCGIQYGCHFVLYRDHPSRAHSDYAVTLIAAPAAAGGVGGEEEEEEKGFPSAAVSLFDVPTDRVVDFPPSRFGAEWPPCRAPRGVTAAGRDGCGEVSAAQPSSTEGPETKRSRAESGGGEDLGHAMGAGVAEGRGEGAGAAAAAGPEYPTWIDIQSMCRLNVQVRGGGAAARPRVFPPGASHPACHAQVLGTLICPPPPLPPTLIPRWPRRLCSSMYSTPPQRPS